MLFHAYCFVLELHICMCSRILSPPPQHVCTALLQQCLQFSNPIQCFRAILHRFTSLSLCCLVLLLQFSTIFDFHCFCCCCCCNWLLLFCWCFRYRFSTRWIWYYDCSTITAAAAVVSVVVVVVIAVILLPAWAQLNLCVQPCHLSQSPNHDSTTNRIIFTILLSQDRIILVAINRNWFQ